MIQSFQILGIISGILTSIRFIPQVIKTVKTKSTRDLSAWFLIIVFLQSLFLILYGWFLPSKDFYVINMNIFPLLCTTGLLAYKWKYK